ncbi:MAG: asparagine synthase (glutamine-hydrolyzing) [Myxococcota bacterium]
MCGITGWVAPLGARPSIDTLKGMMNQLRHRGPDDEGHHLDERCALGHRRLSIIDLAGGRQPFSAAGDTVWSVANGEIYNFRELRRTLQKAGHAFRSGSDNEVIAHGYAEWGEALVDRLEGMFAFAIWDQGHSRLLLARDRMGQKPLYFGRWSGGSFVFGSEPKAVLAHPDAERAVDPDALAAYLVFESVPAPACIHAGLHKLGPGELLSFDARRSEWQTRCYWTLGRPRVPVESPTGFEDAVQRVRTELVRSTADRLVSDVPLGVFLSGGVDSSLVTAAMAQTVPVSGIQTFSIGFEEASYDERSHAEAVARHLGTQHHVRVVSPAEMLEVLDPVAALMDEPLGDASIIPTYLLSAFAREEVTVALGGDGGDELFLGYPTFTAEYGLQRLGAWADGALARSLGPKLRQLVDRLPASTGYFSLDFKLKRFARGLGAGLRERHVRWMCSFLPEELAGLLGRPEAREFPDALVHRELPRSADPFSDLTDHYARLYLAPDVLVKVDRASMAHGLELRSPLLDRRLVELVRSLPSALLIPGGRLKRLLKEVARPWLPASILERRKQGFAIPIAAWLRGPLRERAGDLLSRERLARQGLLDPGRVSKLWDEHQSGGANHGKPLWTLLALQLWWDRWGPG